MVASLVDSFNFSVGVLPHYLKFKSLTEELSRPFVSLKIENDNYIVKTADNLKELKDVHSLRFQVFHREFSSRKINFTLFPYDIDRFDFKCDHLIVQDKQTGKVVATYRVLSSQQTENQTFYSQSEFNLDDFLRLPGHKLELGRACVHQDFRNGAVISLLWKGLCAYARMTNSKYLFGCSSVVTKDLPNLSKITKELEDRKVLVKDCMVHALPQYKMAKYNLLFQNLTAKKSDAGGMNSLMNMYILAGAKMYPDYAYDADMGCVDIFTVVDLEKMPPSFIRRFT